MKKEGNKKRSIMMYLVSAMIALVVSVAVIGGYHAVREEPVTLKHLSADNGHSVLYTADKEGNIVPLDFTETTKRVLDAVVHVKSTIAFKEGQGNNLEYRQLPDPFRDFFKQGPFGEYFDRPGPEGGDNWAPQPMIGSGSGVIINEKGYIITNNHVIRDADEIEVTLHNNETYKATVIGTDPNTDLALIQIKADGLKALPLVNSDDVQVGEWVLAVGNPYSLTSTVTAGIVSAKARNININKEKFAVESFIQTDAAINPGNSGGALVNLDGGLVGINTAIASRTGTYNGYGFAVPSNIVSKVVEDLLKYGTVQRGVLGITIRTVDGNLAREKDMDFTPGVYVEAVSEKSAADKAGIRKGDIILNIDDTKTTTSPALQEIIARHRPGDKVTVTVQRKGSEQEIDVVLENAKGTTEISSVENNEVFNMLGADFETLPGDEAQRLNIAGGVRVVNLYPGKLRQETQMRPGFIITHIDGREVRKVEEVYELLQDKKGGIMLEGIYEDMPGRHYYAFGLDQ